MVFLTPLFLFGLLAAAIPVAIHLIRKEKPPKVLFSSIRFLKKTSKKLVLFQQLQQLLLLSLRSLLLVLLVLAFARPLIDSTVARLLDSDPQSAVVMLDLSMSMHYADTFEQAKAELQTILDDMSAGDEVAFIGFTESADIVSELDSDLDRIRGLVDSIEEPGFGSTRFLPSLRLADQILETALYDNRAIYLISDFQSIGIDEPEDGWKLAAGIAFTGIEVGESRSENLALTDVRSPEQLLEASSEQQILARVRSTGNSLIQEGDVSLLINGELVDRQAFNLSDQSEAVIAFDAEFESEGNYVGEVRVAGDEFLTDNSRFFSVEVLPKINVLLVNGEASENWFEDEGHWLGLAISGPDKSPFELSVIEPDSLSAAALRQNDVAVLLNVGNLAPAQSAAMENFVLTGGSVLIAPGDRVEAGRFNNQFASFSAAAVQPPLSSSFDDYLVIADYDRRHPILSSLNSDWSARFEEYWSLVPNGEASVIMQFDSAEPALVEQKIGEGKSLVFASSLDLEWNNLALQGLFLPFIHETLQYLASAENIQREFEVGDNISMNVNNPDQAPTAVYDSGEEISVLAGNNGITASKPGLITVSSGDESTRYAVNLIAAESNLSRAPFSNLYDRVINSDTNPNQSRAVQTEQMVQELEGPQRLWWWILCAVALLIFAEALVANRTYR